jgi:hypothetical protein
MIKKVLFLSVIIFYACGTSCEGPDLVTPRQPFTGNSIKIDGIYFSKNRQFFLYRNGVMSGGCRDEVSTKTSEKFRCSLDPKIIEAGKDYKRNWGIFFVKNDTITIEEWGWIGDCKYGVFNNNGKIINDSTLLIPINNQGTLLDTFRFAYFYPKPDSTNSVIK